jgi:hypothetical protein
MPSIRNFIISKKWVILTVSIFSLTIVALYPIDSYAFFHENLFGSQSPSSSEDGFTTYQDYSSGITIKHPSDWAKIKEEPGSILFKSSNDLAGLGVETEPVELLGVIKTPDLPEIHLEEEKKLHTEYNTKELPGFKLIESNMTTVDGNPAYRMVYLAKPDIDPEPDRWFKFLNLVSIKGEMRYSFLFAIYPASFDKLLPTIEKTIDSIKITTLD